MNIRLRIVHLSAPVPGTCIVCGGLGHHSHGDADFGGLVCDDCVPFVILAEHLLLAAQMDQPPIELMKQER